MAYINFFGNCFFDCVVVASPTYKEAVGEYGAEMTKCIAKCKEATPEGLQTINVNLLFFGAFAIPAMKIPSGMCLVALGREVVKERYAKGRDILERTIYVDWWFPRDIDPLGHLEELKVRVEQKTREREFKEAFWAWLNTEPVKALILNWFITWLREHKDETENPEDQHITDH